MNPSFNTHLRDEWPKYRDGILREATVLASRDVDLKQLLEAVEDSEGHHFLV
jgi:hypothetical protein